MKEYVYLKMLILKCKSESTNFLFVYKYQKDLLSGKWEIGLV